MTTDAVEVATDLLAMLAEVDAQELAEGRPICAAYVCAGYRPRLACGQ